MSYPKPDDPDYCPSSREPIKDHDPKVLWFRCPTCGRLICGMGKTGRFFPHVKNKKRARRGDHIQESLAAAGLNTKRAWRPVDAVYAEPESEAV